MIKKKYRTTPLLEPGQRANIEIREAAKPPALRSVQVIRLLVSTFVKTQFGKKDDQAKGVAWRIFFEKLAGMWIKVGQLVAMRNDLFGADFTRELLKLQYRAPCFPFSDVQRIVEEGLGKPIPMVFAHFDPVPLAAASLAQVHKAVLLSNGKTVAVKVQRPYAGEFLKKDLRIICNLFGFLSRLPPFRTMMLNDMYNELKVTLTEEVDFRYEALNLKEAKQNFKKYNIYVPAVYKRYSSEKVVVMEYIQGTTMSEYITAFRENPERLEQWLHQNKIKPKRVGSFLLRSMWQQTFEDNYFHGDLQPGNIMLLARNRVAFIDLGSVGSIDQEALNYYRQQLTAIGERNYSKAAEFALLASPDIPVQYNNPIRKSIVRGLKVAEQKSALTDIDIELKTTVHNASSEMTKELVHYGVSPNWNFLKLMRTFSTMDPSVVHLYPKVDMRKEFARYTTEARERRFSQEVHSGKELALRFLDSVSLVAKWLRNESIDFKNEISRGMMIVAWVLDVIKWIVVLAIVLWLLARMRVLGGVAYELVTEWWHPLPHLPVVGWICVGVVLVLLVKSFVQLVGRLKQPVRRS